MALLLCALLLSHLNTSWNEFSPTRVGNCLDRKLAACGRVSILYFQDSPSAFPDYLGQAPICDTYSHYLLLLFLIPLTDTERVPTDCLLGPDGAIYIDLVSFLKNRRSGHTQDGG